MSDAQQRARFVRLADVRVVEPATTGAQVPEPDGASAGNLGAHAARAVAALDQAVLRRDASR